MATFTGAKLKILARLKPLHHALRYNDLNLLSGDVWSNFRRLSVLNKQSQSQKSQKNDSGDVEMGDAEWLRNGEGLDGDGKDAELDALEQAFAAAGLDNANNNDKSEGGEGDVAGGGGGWQWHDVDMLVNKSLHNSTCTIFLAIHTHPTVASSWELRFV